MDHVADLHRRLPTLVRADNAVVFVDNTASVSVAETYPALLRAGVHVVTPNKKAFSGSQNLYDQIVAASREGGAKFLHEATVGAGLPVVSTLKDLVLTGDKVRSTCMSRGLCNIMIAHSHHDVISRAARDASFYLSLAVALTF